MDKHCVVAATIWTNVWSLDAILRTIVNSVMGWAEMFVMPRYVTSSLFSSRIAIVQYEASKKLMDDNYPKKKMCFRNFSKLSILTPFSHHFRSTHNIVCNVISVSAAWNPTVATQWHRMHRHAPCSATKIHATSTEPVSKSILPAAQATPSYITLYCLCPCR